VDGKLAVVLIHGIEINDPHFADGAIRLLKRAFRAETGADPDTALAIRTAFWAPVSQPYEDRLLRRLSGGNRGHWFYDWLDRAGTAADAGRVTPLLGAGLSALLRVLPGGPDLHYPTLRWLLTQYVGDAIAYSGSPRTRRFYDEVHAVLARAIAGLAGEAGPDAPLCVIGHSMGTIITSDYFYDLQWDVPPAPEVAAARGDTPLDRGETLRWCYTMGSPIALWTLQYADDELDRPMRVPDPGLARRHPELDGGWVNVYDRDDAFASALGELSPAYAAALTDQPRSVGPWPLGWTPAAHLGYWNDAALMGSIGARLGKAWKGA
jgi:hypothetical protein